MQELSASGFVVGKNAVLERRALEGRGDRAPALVAELIGLRVDVLVVYGTLASLAAKAATTTIPVVMLDTSDPVASGLVVSLARPGGNITGLTDFEDDLYPKRFELLKAAAPRTARVAFVQEDKSLRFDAAAYDALKRKEDAAAQALGIDLLRIVMRTSQDFEKVTATIMRERVDALLLTGQGAYVMRREFAEFAIRQRLPLMVSGRAAGTGGALMSYGPDPADNLRKAATFVAKILNGAKPADLPIERPTKVELVINLKTAKAIGLTIPQSLLLRADELIQ
ncbi:MAG TPA: ABC transporter substrate-binding protein [Bradyrhizobium sp.]